jgi:long-chain acyl-CoA synthetase
VTTLDYFADDRTVPETTLTELFFDAVDRRRDRTALRRLKAEEEIEGLTYADVLERVKEIVCGLRAAGLERGDRAAIYAENCVEWALTDWACLCAGVVPVPIYPSLTAPQVAYILRDSEVKVVFVSAQLAERMLAAIAQAGGGARPVAFGTVGVFADRVEPWSDFLSAGADRLADLSDARFREAALSATADDVATMLYTSGTTGTPKGVMLTHANVASNVRAVCMVLEVEGTDTTVSFLPLSHILQRMADYLFFWTGCAIGYPRSLDTLIPDLKTFQPTIVVSVPRIYEKIYNGIMAATGPKKRLIDWAASVADRVATLRLEGREPTGLLGLKYRVGDALVFRKVKRTVGGRLRFFVSGGGPLSPELNRFFYSIGLTILEGYGLTETSPVTNVNTVEHFRIGTVGRPVPGTEIRIAADGEILVRGPQVMKGYYRNPEATAAVIDGEGWFATGDIGEIDADGFLKITDRKKDLIVTAGGKNVAPQPIENRLKTHPLVEQAVLVGDRRRYCSLLVVPAFNVLEGWARGRDIEWKSREELTSNPRVVEYVQSELWPMLGDLASFEKPKKLALISEEFTVENGFLTPTLKVKRRVVQERLDAVIDALYAEEASADVTGV